MVGGGSCHYVRSQVRLPREFKCLSGLAILHKNFAVRLEERPVVQNIVPLEPSLVVVITCMIECENA